MMINKCIKTSENQEYDYELAGQTFHSVLSLVTQGVKADIISKWLFALPWRSIEFGGRLF